MCADPRLPDAGTPHCEPLFIGLVWEGIAIPTTALGDGSLAKIHDGLMVDDAAAKSAPLPHAVWAGLVLLISMAGVAAVRRRGRAWRYG